MNNKENQPTHSVIEKDADIKKTQSSLDEFYAVLRWGRKHRPLEFWLSLYAIITGNVAIILGIWLLLR